MSKQRTYTGHSGQLAVMAELLARQCNVAVPEVDWGTDLFAFVDERELILRLQVKAAHGKPYKVGEGYSVQFDVPLDQMHLPEPPVLYYVLVARVGGRFADYLIISRAELKVHRVSEKRFGTENQSSGNLVLTVQFRPSQVRCGPVDLTAHRNAWERLPVFYPTAAVSREV